MPGTLLCGMAGWLWSTKLDRTWTIATHWVDSNRSPGALHIRVVLKISCGADRTVCVYCSNLSESDRVRRSMCLQRPGRIWLKKGVCVCESNKSAGSVTPGPRFDYVAQ